MIEPASDPAHPDHAAWHTEHGLPDPDGLLGVLWDRLGALTAADTVQILLATREIEAPRLIAARLVALGRIGSRPLELELDEFRLREILADFAAREPAAAPDEAARKILYGAVRDAILAFAAVQTPDSLSRAEYAVLTDAWRAA